VHNRTQQTKEMNKLKNDFKKENRDHKNYLNKMKIILVMNSFNSNYLYTKVVKIGILNVIEFITSIVRNILRSLFTFFKLIIFKFTRTV